MLPKNPPAPAELDVFWPNSDGAGVDDVPLLVEAGGLNENDIVAKFFRTFRRPEIQ